VVKYYKDVVNKAKDEKWQFCKLRHIDNPEEESSSNSSNTSYYAKWKSLDSNSLLYATNSETGSIIGLDNKNDGVVVGCFEGVPFFITVAFAHSDDRSRNELDIQVDPRRFAKKFLGELNEREHNNEVEKKIINFGEDLISDKEKEIFGDDEWSEYRSVQIRKDDVPKMVKRIPVQVLLDEYEKLFNLMEENNEDDTNDED